MTPDVNVVLLDFPNPGKEMVFENEDGSYTILINAKLSIDGRMSAYKHAMKHIDNNDFQKDNVQTIEAVAHSIDIPEDAERLSSERFLNRIKAIRAERRRIKKKLQELESELEVKRSMEPWDGLTVPSNQSWFGGNYH